MRHCISVESTTQQFWKFVYRHRYTQLLLPILGLIGAADIWQWVVTGDWPWLLMMVGAIAFGAVIMAWTKTRSVKLLDVDQCRSFFPFLNGISDDVRKKFYLPRVDLLSNLIARLSQNKQGHLIMVGESGSGKTTLLEFLKTEHKSSETKFLLIPSTDISTHKLIAYVVGESKFRQDLDLDNILQRKSALKIGEDSFSNWVGDLEAYLEAEVDDNFVILFDQAENFKNTIEKFDDVERKTFISVLEIIRKNSSMRTVFSVRSEKMANITSLFSQNHFEIFYVPGFEVSNASRVKDILSDRLADIGLNDIQIDQVFVDFSRTESINAFDFQVAGYAYECFGATLIDEERKKRTRSPNMYFDLVHDGMLDEYGYSLSDHYAASELEVVLFTIAYYNKSKSISLSTADAVNLCQIPNSHFYNAIGYLERKRMFVMSDKENGRLRICHDRLIDGVLMKEPRYLQPEQQVAIRKIVDELPGRMPQYHVLDYVSPFLKFARRNSSGRSEYGNPETFLLWIFAALYFLRIAYPIEFSQYLAGVNEFLNTMLPGIVFPADQSNYFFIPIAFTQYIWVSIVYGMNRGFFYYFWQQETGPVLSMILKIIGPMGAFLGLIFSYAPALFIISIAIPGAILGGVYVIIARRSQIDTGIYRYMNFLGWSTLVNMLIEIGVMYLLIASMRIDSSINIFELAWLNFLICALFCYFAYQMRFRQGTDSGRGRMLAMYSAGRKL